MHGKALGKGFLSREECPGLQVEESEKQWAQKKEVMSLRF